MPVPPYEPKPDLTTERVRGGRWKGLVVLAVAVVIVGGLIWKPWDQPSSAVPTPPLVGAAHPSPSPLPVPTLSVIPDYPGVLEPPPTPAGPPPTTGVPAVTDEPSPSDTQGSLGSVSLESPVTCVYVTNENPQSLTNVFVDPPVITTSVGGGASQLRAVSWTAVLETNQLSEIFEADWRPIDVSTTHVFTLHGRNNVIFKPVTFDVRSLPVGTADVLRVTVLVNWIGPHGTRLFQTSVVESGYAPADNPDGVVPEGCSSTLLSVRH